MGRHQNAADSRTELFLSGAGVIAVAIGDALVKARWDAPSVLEDQLVSGLAAHLARGGVWVVAEFLERGVPERPVDCESAAEYFAAVVTRADAQTHRAGRARAAEIASRGQAELETTLRARLAELESELPARSPMTPIEVTGDKVMRLGDYLETRIVEQCVHLDDLARSAGHEPWPLPAGHREATIAIGTEIAEHLHGTDAVLRALYRRGFAQETFPVL